MSAPITEFVLETVLRDGLGELRTNPDLLDDIFGKFLSTYFINQYGQNQINELKTYIQNNQIKIVHSWAMVPFEVPCFTIELLRAGEEEDDQQFGNAFENVDASITPQKYIDNVIPVTYDPKNGKMTVDDSTDLSLVRPGYVFVDNSGNKFRVKNGNSNLNGAKFINIGKDQSPDLGGSGYIESPIDFERTERRMIRIREILRVGCHAKDKIHLTKYIYYLLIYILKSRQKSLIDRGINLDRGIGDVFDRAEDFEGENIFSRYIEMHCLTEFDWDQEKVNLVDNFELTTKTPTPNPNSAAAKKYNTSDD